MRIAVLDDYHGVSVTLADWGDLAEMVTVFGEPIPKDELVGALEDFEVLCVMRERTPLPEEVIEALPRLRLIVTTGHRNASIDVAAARSRGIVVCGTDSRAVATAQLAVTLILAGLRNLPAEMASIAQGGWQAAPGRDLQGLTVGLVGLGRLGAQVAELLRPFGANVIAWSQNLTEERCAEVDVGRAISLPALLEQSDVVSLHVVLSDQTRGLIGAPELYAMKSDALLVNTSRGPIVDCAALLEALRAGRPARAAVDVFETEPLPSNDPMRDADLIASGRLILTPHIGYGSQQTYRLMYTQTVEAVRAWLEGSPVREIS